MRRWICGFEARNSRVEVGDGLAKVVLLAVGSIEHIIQLFPVARQLLYAQMGRENVTMDDA
jgi:hypothetical protein